jgi:hypothetical protein
MKPLNSSSPNMGTFICKIPMKTNLTSKQNYIPLPLSPAQMGGCLGNMRLTMTLSQCIATRGLRTCRLTSHNNLFLTLWSLILTPDA